MQTALMEVGVGGGGDGGERHSLLMEGQSTSWNNPNCGLFFFSSV